MLHGDSLYNKCFRKESINKRCIISIVPRLFRQHQKIRKIQFLKQQVCPLNNFLFKILSQSKYCGRLELFLFKRWKKKSTKVVFKIESTHLACEWHRLRIFIECHIPFKPLFFVVRGRVNKVFDSPYPVSY